MLNQLVEITESLAIRADEVKSIRTNAFNATEIVMVDGTVWRTSVSVRDSTQSVNVALACARAALKEKADVSLISEATHHDQ